MIKDVRGKDYLDRLKELNLWTLEERRNTADLVELFKMYKGFTAIHSESLFRDLRIVFFRSNRISNRIGRPIRFLIEFSNRIGRIYHASRNTV